MEGPAVPDSTGQAQRAVLIVAQAAGLGIEVTRVCPERAPQPTAQVDVTFQATEWGCSDPGR
ncbi:MAG: hypothetical protein QGH15_24000, partial [Kiritimatiellia bacterium]|nr:hypothetical protein [Kiritimatiellia bacterium]